MKYFLTILCCTLFTLSAFAQPSNNDCANLVDLGTAPVCTGDIYTNVDATSSSTGPSDVPTCFNGGVVRNDVYFSFQIDPSLVDVTITINGTDMGPNGIPIENVQFALYRGSCAGLAELNCVSSPLGSTVASLDVVGLTPGTTYFLRVDSYSESGTPVWGDFTVCIEEFIPFFNMGESSFTSSCNGTVYDSGGPDGEYGNNENFAFTICPNDFSQCIALDVQSFNIMGGDALNVYQGNDTDALLIASITGNNNDGEFIVESADQCITLEFISGGTGTSAGFVANWQCTPIACGGSTFGNATTIDAIPFNNSNLTTCGEGANFNTTPCGMAPFLNGPETVFLYQSPGGLCASINVTGAEFGTGVAVLNGLPEDPATVCLAQSGTGQLDVVDFQEPGDYYIIVANGSGCTDFGLNIVEVDCILSPSLVNALCNPLNGCIDEGDLVTELIFENGEEDVELNDNNAGCWQGNGAEPDYLWFTIEAQADGPFGFILSGTNVNSDIDISVWGPFSPEEVCETPNDVINTISTTQPIRSSYTGGNQSTGLVDIHPITGIMVTDAYDCGSPNTPNPGGDDFVRTIPAQEGEVYVVLANDFGDQITDGNISIDWGPSAPDVLAPISATVAVSDTSVCAGSTVQIEVVTGLDNIEWIGDNTDELSCTNCLDPVANPDNTTVYTGLLDAVCYVDTVEVVVNVYDLDAGPDIEVCLGETFEIPAGQDFTMATYAWDPPAGLTFSCTDCATPVVTADEPGVYEVDVTLTAEACNFMDILTITVLDFTAAEFTIADDDRICFGESIDIGGDPVAGNNYTWTSVPTSDIEPVANPNIQPDVTTTYFVSVTNGICPTPSVDSVTVTVTQLPIAEIAETPDILCQGDAITLSNAVVQDGVTYSWTGPNEILNPDSSTTVLIPQATGNYTITADRQGCQETDVQLVEVTPILIDLNQPDIFFMCNTDDPLQVTPTVVPSNAIIAWTPEDFGTNTPLLQPESFTVYTATVTVDNCVRSDTFAIQVDSLPSDMSIMADPFEDPYCRGELVTLFSPIYDPVFYPDIMHQWVSIGLETSDTLYNLVLTTLDTFTYIRNTVNGGCMQSDSILLNVVTNEALEVSPTNPEICPGDSIQLSIADPTLEEIAWSPSSGLSCTDCPNPMATPETTTTYTVSSTVEGCAIEQTVTVAVLDDPAPFLLSSETICEDEVPIALNPNGQQQAGTSYTWTANNDPNFSSMEVNPIVSPTSTTTYAVVANNICGTINSEMTVTILEPGTLSGVNGGLDTLVTCRGFEFTLDADVQLSPNGVNFLGWTYSGATEESASATFIAVESGLAVFEYAYGENESLLCDQSSAQVFVVVNDAPEDVQLIDDQLVCFDEIQTFILNEGTGEPGVSYSWTGTDGFTSIEPDPEVTPTATTTYVLEASLGDCVVVDSVTITVTPAATLTAGQGQLVTPDVTTVTLTAETTGGNPADIQWTFQGQNIGSGSPLDWTPTADLRMELPGFAFATLDTGCEVIVDSVLLQNYQMPDIFSPNGDGQNDLFRPFFLGEMDIMEVTVYNRWGQVIFETNDVNSPGWDGTNDDKQAPSDVYIYTVRLGYGGVTVEDTGQITLLR